VYLHLGNNKMIKTDSVIGIFDLDNATVSKRTRQFLNRAEKKGEVVTVGFELPKSFVVTANGRKNKKVYLSALSSKALHKRSGYIDSL